MEERGRLYLIPTPLGKDAMHTLPPYVLETIHHLQDFIVEKAKTARQLIKSTNPPYPIQSLHIEELNKRTPMEALPHLLQPLREGRDVGLMSEAGCPGVADPGAAIVRLAHQEGITVKPLVGPSSILLALMASGMNGQSFCFHGYLPPKKPDLIKKLKQLEQNARRLQQTQLFIETPYRNRALIEAALEGLHPNTRFCLAANLTTAEELIINLSIGQWKKQKAPNIHKVPTIFLIA
ncbi:MAG: SAM-dependent methyltransferase [Bacteroidota bacterium]